MTVWPMKCAGRRCERVPFPTSGYCSKACAAYATHEAERRPRTNFEMAGRIKIQVKP